MKVNSLKKRIFSGIVAIAMAAGMFLVNVDLALAAWSAPTAPQEPNADTITVAAKRAAQTMPEILGANIVATNNIGGSGASSGNPVTLAEGNGSAMLGIFGTSLNDAPDPFYWNYYYNLYATENGLTMTDDAVLTGAAGAPNAADTTIVGSYGTSISLSREPDILLGTNAVNGVSYDDLIAVLPENNDDDLDNDYNPYQIAYGMTSTYDMADTMIAMANAMQEIENETGKSGRYGDPYQIAVDYDKYIKGITAYVLSELEAQNKEQLKVAVINPTPQADGTFEAFTSYASSGTAGRCRGAEYVDLCTENIIATLGSEATVTDGKCYLTADQIVTNADVIVFGVSVSTATDNVEQVLKNALDATRTDGSSSYPKIISSLPTCVYGITMNSAENGIGFGYYLGALYQDIIDINPAHMVTYFYERFFHISDDSKLKGIVIDNFSNASGITNIDISLKSYNKADVENQIIAGLNYYNEHKEDAIFANAYYNLGDKDWNPDMSVGIGATN